MGNAYSAENIQVLEGLEAVRKRPGMYIGNTNKKGLHHLVYEVVDNSVDEFSAGFGDKIEVTIKEDNIVEVRDYGRGIPVEMHSQKGIPACTLVLTTLHAGGKFDNKTYKTSGGLHGVGISVVNALSEQLDLSVFKDNKEYYQHFEAGVPQTKLKNKKSNQKSGTKITFKPDDKIFDTLNFDFEVLKERLRELAFLNQNLKIVIEDKRKGKEKKKNYKYSGGIKEFIGFINEDKEKLTDDLIYFKEEKGEVTVEVALQYINDFERRIYSFANNINTHEGGKHLTGFKTSFTKIFNKQAEEKNLVKKSHPEIGGKQIREGITAIINVKLPDPQFEGQTKTKLGNNEIRGIVEEAMYDNLPQFLNVKKELVKKVYEKAVESVKAKEAQRKRKKLSKRKNKLSNSKLPWKLADCSSRKKENSEIYIVEGDSAGGSAKQGRDRKHQAILPLKGKIINAKKKKLNRILKNDEVKSIITSLGTGILDDFDEEELRYEKVIIMTDADDDGFHIQTLLLTFFYTYMRPLIEKGYLYIARPPLYKVSRGKNEEYIFNQEKLEEYFANRKRKQYNIQRFKGLGEMNPKELYKTTMKKEKRKLDKVNIEDDLLTDNLINKLMGKKSKPRREFIKENSEIVG